MDERILELPDGRKLGYCIYGDPEGLPLLALHGTPGSHLMMQPGAPAAAARGVRMIAPDRPGYGRSSARSGYRLADWVEDIRFLLHDLELERFMVFGVSGGGPFAAALAALMPQRVQAMALASPVGLIDEGLKKRLNLSQRAIFDVLPRHPLLTGGLFQLSRLVLLTAPKLALALISFRFSRTDKQILAIRPHKDELIATFRDGIRQGVSGPVEDLRIFASPWQVPLETIEAPVALWQGDCDRQVPPQAARNLSDRLRGCRFHALPGQGHFWVLEHFDEVLDELLRLRAEHPAAVLE